MKQLLCFFLALLCVACQEKTTPQPPDRANDAHTNANFVSLDREQLLRLELGLYEVSRETLRYEVKIPADVFASPTREAFVGASIAGRVQKIFVSENDVVQKGEKLAVLESATIANLVAELIESASAFKVADADYRRKQKIATENILSEKVMLESESARRIAEAKLFAAEAKCLGAGLSKEDIERIKAKPDSAVSSVVIRANLSGVVAKRFITLGEYVEPNKPLFHLVSLDEVMLVGNVFEPEFGKVRAGQPVEVYVGAFHSERFTGKIHSVGAVVNETTHALPVRVLLRNPEHKLKPSMHAEMHITVESDAPELLVPSRAIGIDGEEKFVFVQKSDTLFEARKIKIKEETKEFATVAEGLREGEKIATKNIFFLKSQWKASQFVED
jgi:cobalt-zinc-cadmium efflux system membrane fusion protein